MPIKKNVAHSETTIGLTISRSAILFPGECLAIQWNVAYARRVLNDLTVREWLSSDCYRGLNPQRGLSGQRGLFVERNAELPTSALYRLVAISLAWMSNPLALDSSIEPSLVQCKRDPGDTTLQKRLVVNTPIYYERNIRNLMTLALAHDVQPVIST